MDNGSLLGNNSFLLAIDISLVFEKTSFNEFLGVVPSTTGVGVRESDLDTGNDVTSQKSRDESVGEKNSTEERSKDNNSSGGNHLLEGRVG